MNQFKIEFEKASTLKPYKEKRVTQMALRSSVIPRDQARRVSFYLDEDSYLALAAKGLQHKMTVDEMLRRSCWLLVSQI